MIVVLRGVVSIAAMYAVPILAAQLADSLVGIPYWLVVAPVIAWAAFTILFLALAVGLGVARTIGGLARHNSPVASSQTSKSGVDHAAGKPR